MRVLLLLLVVLLGVWLWRSSRSGGKAQGKSSTPASPQPQDMVRCASCQVHVPRADSIAGRLGVYCCPEHRQRAEP